MFNLLESLKKNKKRIGFTCGTFDVLHPGHVMMLQESKAHCDHLIVGLLSDPTISRPTTKNKPVQSMWERFVQLQAINVVDWIFPFDTEEDIINMLQMIRPHVRFVGEEYKNFNFTGRQVCTDLGIEIFYNTRTHKYSSTELRSRDTIKVPNGEQTKQATRKYGKFFPCVGCVKDCKTAEECLLYGL